MILRGNSSFDIYKLLKLSVFKGQNTSFFLSSLNFIYENPQCVAGCSKHSGRSGNLHPRPYWPFTGRQVAAVNCLSPHPVSSPPGLLKRLICLNDLSCFPRCVTLALIWLNNFMLMKPILEVIWHPATPSHIGYSSHTHRLQEAIQTGKVWPRYHIVSVPMALPSSASLLRSLSPRCLHCFINSPHKLINSCLTQPLPVVILLQPIQELSQTPFLVILFSLEELSDQRHTALCLCQE